MADAGTTLTVDPENPEDAIVARAAREIAAGGVVALPTETFYGLAADPWSEAAIAALFRIKCRPPESPILLLLADASQAPLACESPGALFERLSRAFWPGPLTLVVPAREDLPAELTAGTGTIGLRTPGLALPRRIAARLGRPITGTSANRSGDPPTRSAAEARASLGEMAVALKLLLDGGTTRGGSPSTVVDASGAAPRLIREGAIPFARILAAASA